MVNFFQPLGIGMIGYGGIGRVHAMGYRDLGFHYGLPADRVRLVGVATTHAQTAERAAREIGCPVWTADYHELLARDDIQVIDVCVPNNRHEEIVLAAAAAGKHIYCEKPLALDAAQAVRMAAAVERAGIKAQVTFNFRFIPAVVRARQLLVEGLVGRVFSFRCWYFRSSYISPQRPLTWRFSREASGGGALFDLGSHLLDLVRFLLGDVAQVRAMLETRIPERPLAGDPSQMCKVEVDDLAFLHMRLADGTPGAAEISRLATGATNEMELEIFGESGAIHLSLTDPNWLYVYDVRASDKPDGGRRGYTRVETIQRFDGALAPDWTQPMSFVRSHAECQYQFLRSIWEDRVPQPDFWDGTRVQEIMDAALVSARDNRWADVEQKES
jgi:predicted dehydrogenase